MFSVTEADVTAIRSVLDTGGELAAAMEFRQRFPSITDIEHARECVRIIVKWQPLPVTHGRLARAQRPRTGKG